MTLQGTSPPGFYRGVAFGQHIKDGGCFHGIAHPFLTSFTSIPARRYGKPVDIAALEVFAESVHFLRCRSRCHSGCVWS